MPYSVAFKNAFLDDVVAAIGTIYGSMHTANPGSSGTSEATGGSPAYARKALSLAAASGGAKALSATPTFDLPAGTYGWVGFWTASTGGTYLGYATVTSFTLASQDIYTLLSGSLTMNAAASA